MPDDVRPGSITDGKLLVWQEDDATMSHEDHEDPAAAFKRLSRCPFLKAQIKQDEDHGDWHGFLMLNGWVVSFSPMGGEVYMPEPKGMRDLRARVAALEAELAKKDELLHECLPAVRNNAQAEAEGGDPFAAAAWNVIADCVEASLAPKEPHVQGT